MSSLIISKDNIVDYIKEDTILHLSNKNINGVIELEINIGSYPISYISIIGELKLSKLTINSQSCLDISINKCNIDELKILATENDYFKTVLNVESSNLKDIYVERNFETIILHDIKVNSVNFRQKQTETITIVSSVINTVEFSNGGYTKNLNISNNFANLKNDKIYKINELKIINYFIENITILDIVLKEIQYSIWDKNFKDIETNILIKVDNILKVDFHSLLVGKLNLIANKIVDLNLEYSKVNNISVKSNYIKRFLLTDSKVIKSLTISADTFTERALTIEFMHFEHNKIFIAEIILYYFNKKVKYL